MRTLAQSLAKVFSAHKTRKPNTQQKARDQAMRLAAQHHIEIERLDGGMNVWPPASVADTPADPYGGDHYAEDW